jgi:hypothetical protein
MSETNYRAERFYPWQALVDSWREDIALLQGRLKATQSK